MHTFLVLSLGLAAAVNTAEPEVCLGDDTQLLQSSWSGMEKAKKYDWKDSNIAVWDDSKRSAVSSYTEPAWQGAGQVPGLEIWRIEQFTVVPWPREDFGKFYSGDSYIVLSTYKDAWGELQYDVHFWIGKDSSEDEYNTAQYKTVELDTFLDDKPVQHREVQGAESSLFKSYFEDGITIMKGGTRSGFERAQLEATPHRLFKIEEQADRTVTMEEVPMKISSLDEYHVYVLSANLEVYQINGAYAPKTEKWKGATLVAELKASHPQSSSVQTSVVEGVAMLPESATSKLVG